MKYTEVYQRKAQHICIFGEPKSGKTELAASCAEFFSKVVWISMDNGHTNVFKLLSPSLLEKFEFIILPDTKDNPIAIDTCYKLVQGKNTHICNLHGAVSCMLCRNNKEATWTDINLSILSTDAVVIFDHGSQLSDSAMNFVTKGKKLDFKPGWDEWAHQGNLLSTILTSIQQAPYHCIFITHIQESTMEDGSKRLLPLCGSSNFSRNMGRYFDHIIYSRVFNSKHAFGSATTYIASVLTGSRTDVALEVQNSDAKSARPSLQPFFEGKMDIDVEEAVKKQLEIAKEESKTIENFSEVKKVEVSMEMEVSTEISTVNGVNGHSKEEKEETPTAPSIPTIEKSGAELAKERLAAMKARSLTSTPSLSPSLSSTLSTPAASLLAAKLRGLSK